MLWEEWFGCMGLKRRAVGKGRHIPHDHNMCQDLTMCSFCGCFRYVMALLCRFHQMVRSVTNWRMHMKEMIAITIFIDFTSFSQNAWTFASAQGIGHGRTTNFCLMMCRKIFGDKQHISTPMTKLGFNSPCICLPFVTWISLTHKCSDTIGMSCMSVRLPFTGHLTYPCINLGTIWRPCNVTFKISLPTTVE